MHYKGKIKKQLIRGRIADGHPPPQPGDPIFLHQGIENNTVGTIVRVAPGDKQNNYRILAVVDIDIPITEDLRLIAPNGPKFWMEID